MFIHRLDVNDPAGTKRCALAVNRRLERPFLDKHHFLVRVMMRRMRHRSRHELRDVQIDGIPVMCLSMKDLARFAVRLRIRLHGQLIEDITLRGKNVTLSFRVCRQQRR